MADLAAYLSCARSWLILCEAFPDCLLMTVDDLQHSRLLNSVKFSSFMLLPHMSATVARAKLGACQQLCLTRMVPHERELYHAAIHNDWKSDTRQLWTAQDFDLL